MIIVELNGGLGNQLFQYAAGLSLSIFHNVPIKVNSHSFNSPDPITGTKRNFELDNFLNPPVQASTDEINKLLTHSLLKKNFEKTLPFYKRTVYKEKKASFDRNFFKSRREIYLKGNRQSEKYFKAYERQIKDHFTINKSLLNKRTIDFSKKIIDQNSVSIHVRRGDYLAPIALDVLGVLHIKYYEKAIETIIKKIPNATFYVFTDDVDWTKKNLKIPYSYQIVSYTIGATAIEDFYLMSCCKHNIIANSTFSWWAAWLNSNPDKIVIAPERWFNNGPKDTQDLIPANWIKL